MPQNNEEQCIPVSEFIARNAEAGNYQTVDVAGEREKDKYIGLEEFASKLSLYKLADYLHSDQPYDDLIRYSCGQVGLFDQLAEVLKDMAEQQMHAKNNTPHKRKVADRIAFTKDIYLADLTEVNSILDFINMVEADPDTAEQVSVLPLMCGSGKSTAITLKIKQVIEHGEGLGMLIVTDSTKRLEEIWNENTENPLLGEDVRSFIKAHKDDVTVMEKNSYARAVQLQWQHPVLAMTTQRFFNILTKEEIREFLTWKDHGRRPLILFDEQPYLNEIIDLTPQTVNDIDTMLRMRLVADEDKLLTEDKQWCIRQWEAFRQRFLDKLWEYEYDHEGDLFYYEDEQHSLTEDDERFFRIVKKNKTSIRSSNTDSFRNIHALKTFVDTWGIYSHRVAGSYESKFTVYLDNRDKVQGLGAKVIVLDGTGDISPVYTGQDYIDMCSGMNFVRSLSHLTVKTGDIDTSKSAMSVRNSPVSGTVMGFLMAEGHIDGRGCIFTYKDHEKKFPIYKTAHFGAIKGVNDFSNETCIAQVGLNEMQPVHYLVHMLARNDELRSGLTGLSPEDSCEQIQRIMTDTHNCADVKIAHLLADVDQNMFRSAIRSAKNRQDVTFYLFYKHSYIPQLDGAIRGRYCGMLGGKMEAVSEDTIMAYRPRWTETKADIIYRWYCQWDGSPKKRATIAEETGIDADVLKVTISRNERLRPLFEEAKRIGYEITGKKGWYVKREH